MQKKTDIVVVGIVLGLACVFVASTLFGAYRWLAPRLGGSDPLSRPMPGDLAPEPCKGAGSTEDELSEPLRVRDPSRVDLAELYAQAQPLVLRLAPNAKLTGISSINLAADGVFDSGSGNFSLNFEVRCLQAGAPPGKDVYEGRLLVIVRGGTVTASRDIDGFAPLLSSRGSLPEPPCSTATAWKAAVASGVAANARASFSYSSAPGSDGREAAWLINVPGHPEFKRFVGGQTCEVIE